MATVTLSPYKESFEGGTGSQGPRELRGQGREWRCRFASGEMSPEIPTESGRVSVWFFIL